MNDNHQVISSQYPYNMANWCVEKAHSTLDGIVTFLEWAKAQDNMPQGYKDMQDLHLYPALHDATKLLAFGCGVEWLISDPRDIYEKGREAYDRVLERYGLATGWRSQKKKQVLYFIKRIEELLEGERVPNRTLIHELLEGLQARIPVINRIEALIESVTMGDLEWEDFIILAKTEIAAFKEDSEK